MPRDALVAVVLHMGMEQKTGCADAVPDGEPREGCVGLQYVNQLISNATRLRTDMADVNQVL